MTNTTDTNQASEDDLRGRIVAIFADSIGDVVDDTDDVIAIIRTEKLKLLDELEAKAQEYVVIGEQLRGFPYFITVDNIKAERNKLELEL